LGSVGDAESSIAEDPRTYRDAPAEQIAWLALTGVLTSLRRLFAKSRVNE